MTIKKALKVVGKPRQLSITANLNSKSINELTRGNLTIAQFKKRYNC